MKSEHTTAEQLARYDLKAKKKLGQNFLRDSRVPEKMAAALRDPAGLTVVEIGPGTGILTKELAKRAGKVLAYEIDERLAAVLAEELRPYPNVRVIFEDFLKADLEKDLGDAERVALAANLPYYITTPIIFRALESPIRFESLTVMMQKEVADRYLAGPGDPERGSVSVITEYLYDIRKIARVSKKEFIPEPQVDSVVIQLTAKEPERPAADQTAFFKLVHELFLLRRKTILNNLLRLTRDREKTKAILERAGIRPDLRPQQLTVGQFLDIYEAGRC